MTIDEFERLLLAHGADPAGWPAGARAAAETLLARDPAARALLEESERLDATIAAAAAAAAVPETGALAARILARLDEEPSERVFGLGRLAAWAGSAAAMALFAGFLVGQSLTGVDPARGVLALVTGDLTEIETMP